jgi:hypothetical protein
MTKTTCPTCHGARYVLRGPGPSHTNFCPECHAFGFIVGRPRLIARCQLCLSDIEFTPRSGYAQFAYLCLYKNPAFTRNCCMRVDAASVRQIIVKNYQRCPALKREKSPEDCDHESCKLIGEAA